jgi:hypothetical protein
VPFLPFPICSLTNRSQASTCSHLTAGSIDAA